MEPNTGFVRDVADPGERQTGDAERAVGLGQHLSARLGQRVRQLLALLRIRGAGPCEVRGVARDEVLDTHVREQSATADHNQMVGGHRHLAHQMRGDEDRAALAGEPLHQIADPEDAFRVQAVDRLVEEQHLRDRRAVPRRSPGVVPCRVRNRWSASVRRPAVRRHRGPRPPGSPGYRRAVPGTADGYGRCDRRARPWRPAARPPAAARWAAAGTGDRRSSPGPPWAGRARGSCAWWWICRNRWGPGSRSPPRVSPGRKGCARPSWRRSASSGRLPRSFPAPSTGQYRGTGRTERKTPVRTMTISGRRRFWPKVGGMPGGPAAVPDLGRAGGARREGRRGALPVRPPGGPVRRRAS